MTWLENVRKVSLREMLPILYADKEKCYLFCMQIKRNAAYSICR